jgi:DNA-binding phage protein
MTLERGEVGIWRDSGRQDAANVIDVNEIVQALGDKPSQKAIKAWLLEDHDESQHEFPPKATKAEKTRLIDAWAEGWASYAAAVMADRKIDRQEARETHAADFESPDAAIAAAHAHLGATHVVQKTLHVAVYTPEGKGYVKRELYFSRGKLHWPKSGVAVKTLPADARPIEEARRAAEAPRGGKPFSGPGLSREGRHYEYSEWLDFECEGKTPPAEIRELKDEFQVRAVDVVDKWLEKHGGNRWRIGTYDENSLAWNAYASIVGHGVGLWEGDGDTGLPGDVEKELDKVVRADRELARMAHRISDECAMLRSEERGASESHEGIEIEFPSGRDAADFFADYVGRAKLSHRIVKVWDDGDEAALLALARRYHGRRASEASEFGAGEARREEIFYMYVEVDGDRTFVGTARGTTQREARMHFLRWHPGFERRGKLIAVPERFPPDPDASSAGEEARRQRVRFRFEDEKEWQTSDFDSFIQNNRGALDDLDIQNIRNGKRVTLGGGAQPVVFVELERRPGVRENGSPPRGGSEPLQAREEHEGFASWVDVLVYAKTHEYMLYQAPMDVHPHRVRVVKVFSNGKIRLDPMSRDADPFTADKDHLRRFRREAPRGGGPLAAGDSRHRDYWVGQYRGEWYASFSKGGTDYGPFKTKTEAHRWIDSQARDNPQGGEHQPEREKVTRRAAEANECPPAVAPAEDAVPWVKVTRDPEKYAEGLERAKEIGPIDSARQIYDLLEPVLSKEDQEVFLVVLLDVRQQCRGVAEVARGARSRVSVDRADVARVVAKTGAESFIVVHNHPSGDPTPSQADKELTDSINAAGDTIDIPCIDHVVIGMGKYYSFAEGKVKTVRN